MDSLGTVLPLLVAFSPLTVALVGAVVAMVWERDDHLFRRRTEALRGLRLKERYRAIRPVRKGTASHDPALAEISLHVARAQVATIGGPVGRLLRATMIAASLLAVVVGMGMVLAPGVSSTVAAAPWAHLGLFGPQLWAMRPARLRTAERAVAANEAVVDRQRAQEQYAA
ncbi:hypothetical protein [Nocardiopsis ansamitocini]|uniref:Uncharacterized protein n=1 Tax=Nocardiopsis ansamitocini TaxID=1670832 RepID=A0A9W6P6B9_9ACTN|nr:hypothetical protein [Nocardiopsis ansamitocini]GLU48250.1 hypothetical protein Nans01_26010 [Nocardiopsis ansamitocini]